MDSSELPPFPATLRPTSKTRVAVLASLTMATLVFSVGFGNKLLLLLPEFLISIAFYDIDTIIYKFFRSYLDMIYIVFYTYQQSLVRTYPLYN